MTTQTDPDTWTARAEWAARDLQAHRQLEQAKLDLRNRLVVEAIDTGRTLAGTARALHLSEARIHQILAHRG